MRLTHYDEHKKRWQINNDYGAVIIDELNYAVGEAIDKLAAYEDTGLSPEEIKLNMDGLDEYRKAEAEGRLVILPCKVGDAVWFYLYESGMPKPPEQPLDGQMDWLQQEATS